MYKGRKRERKEESIKRTESSLLKWEEELKKCKDDDFKRLIKKKIERAQTTIKNTKLV
mgnify:CR=1 FL=1